MSEKKESLEEFKDKCRSTVADQYIKDQIASINNKLE